MTSAKPPRQPRSAQGKRRAESTIVLIDRLLRAPVAVTIQGEPTSMTAMEAIVTQLLLKSMSGDKRANRVFLRFKRAARKGLTTRLEIAFADNDYTRRLVAGTEESTND